MSADAKNLERICDAMRHHDARCGRQLVEIRMHQFEVDRLGWDEIRGVPVVASGSVASGRFELVCEADLPEATPVVEERVPATRQVVSG